MVTVKLINKTLFLVGSDGSMVGRTYRTYTRAVRMYLVIAGRLDDKGMLDNKSCIM